MTFLKFSSLFERLRTKRDLLRKEKSLLLPFLEEGVLLIDKEGGCVDCNKAFCRITGLQKEALEGTCFFSLKAKDKEKLLERCQRLLSDVGEDCRELRGSLFYPGAQGSSSIEVRAVCLNKALRVLILKDSYQEYETLKIGKEFIANASHELRTPITIIKGFVETIKDLPEISEAMLSDIFDKILRSCTRMDDIVKNLLILTDLDHLLKAKAQAFDVLALLEHARQTLIEQHPDITVDLLAESVEHPIEADPSLLELAIMNLLHNAVKYSTPPAKIQIQVELLEKVVIRIVDQGIGISRENMPYIFDRFYSVNKALSRRLGGAGLGLSIVKTIIEKHEGQIVVESNPLGGTIFTILLPRH